jgi:hypothetical protein
MRLDDVQGRQVGFHVRDRNPSVREGVIDGASPQAFS